MDGDGMVGWRKVTLLLLPLATETRKFCTCPVQVLYPASRGGSPRDRLQNVPPSSHGSDGCFPSEEGSELRIDTENRGSRYFSRREKTEGGSLERCESIEKRMPGKKPPKIEPPDSPGKGPPVRPPDEQEDEPPVEDPRRRKPPVKDPRPARPPVGDPAPRRKRYRVLVRGSGR
jgi:hypothetical protein